MIYKRGRYYYIDVSIPGQKKRIRRSLNTTKKLEILGKASEKKEELINEHQKKEIKFDDFCEQFMTWLHVDNPGDVHNVGLRLEKIKAFFKSLDLVYLSDITPYHIEQLKAAMKAGEISRGRQDGGMLSKRTMNFYLQIIRRMFYKAIDWEIYSKQNPMKKVRFYNASKQVEFLSKEQIERVFKASEKLSEKPKSPLQKVFYDLVIFALNTGMRKSEILNLRWKEVNGNELTITGKGEKIRSIPLNKEAIRILSKQPRKDEFVFDIPNRSKPFDILAWAVNIVREESTVRIFRFHLLRHFFATSLVEKGVDFITVKEILGHSSLTMSEIYTHTDKEKKQRAVDSLL